MKEIQEGKNRYELKPEDLCSLCDIEQLDFENTEQLDSLEGIIGQSRAVKAIEFGLGMSSFGYNIYAAGIPGTGKKSLIKSFVERIASERETPPDIFYVHNFSQPDHPRVIKVPPGVGCEFKRDMEELVLNLKEEIPKAFKSEDYERQQDEIVQGFQQKRGELIGRVQAEARQRQLLIKGEGPQILTIPMRGGEEMSPVDFENLSEEEQEKIRRKQEELSEVMQDIHREIRDVQQETQKRIKELNRRVALVALGYLLENLQSRYKKCKGIVEYLGEVQEDVLDNLSDFLGSEQEQSQPPVKGARAAASRSASDRYQVNVLVDHSKQKGAPVFLESHPTYRNLIGFMEREASMGTLYTDYTMIRAGSMIQANGGFLILDIADVLLSPFAWEALKRVIQNGEVKIEDVGEQYGFIATAGLQPQPVQVDLKIIVLGSIQLYNLLYNLDEDFQKLFKIKADFDTITHKDERRVMEYARYVKKRCDEEKLKHFDRQAVATVIEHCSRMVSDQTRLTLRFSDVADVIRESSYWASQNGRQYVASDDVRKAIEEKIYRSNLVEERLQEMIDEGSILIQTSGEKAGQINGLSVYQLGDYSFGKPTRITAQVSVGDKGIVNIEREAKLSGNIHDKGVLILSGYLHGKYGQARPLSLNASICFEQSYSGVDGDSASSTELYAILSSLCSVPLKQSIAVTGSINQMGVIQPIGGVNEKIEGFFHTCKASGLSGEQGVMIPKQNVKNLMLKSEVIEAIREGKFHIYAVKTADEGLEILTGRKAGDLQSDGTYPPESIHFLVYQRLGEMAESIQNVSGKRAGKKSAGRPKKSRQ
ncbi:AAA family ATPase [Acidobacteria bacterium AH-259-G07]|nr:AAA family ATPase [Acidobacteria bacterium AH-259-G07]